MTVPFGVTRTAETNLLVPQSSQFRAIVDPEGTLPDVALRIYEKDMSDTFSREKALIAHAGEEIGYCDLITEFDPGLMHFDVITLDTTDRSLRIGELPRRERPKGVGLAAYLIAIETAHQRGFPFYSQKGTLSEGSNHVWEILASQAVAEILEAPQIFDFGDTRKVAARYKA